MLARCGWAPPCTPPPAYPEIWEPETASVTAGVETNVLGMGREDRTADEIAAHPRPNFKNQILAHLNDGMKHRPDSTFDTMNDDVLALRPVFLAAPTARDRPRELVA